MKKVEILMVVDAAAALASRDLQSNIYLIDTNKYMGSGNEGQAELKQPVKTANYYAGELSLFHQTMKLILSSLMGK